ncbi:MAG TPA: class V lanthionine synthetase subunit LxmK [Micromonospora sp.]|nr:class V lanthionine synthetase subunit LxmK [Micromonospora sp.]
MADPPAGTERSTGSDERMNFKPVDLDRYPDVEDLLARLNLGRFVRDTLTAPVGRNDVWAGLTTSGRRVFVKRLVGTIPAEMSDRMRRILSYQHFAVTLPSAALRGPEFLGHDEPAGLLAFAFLEDARNGAELVVDETFDNELAEQVGQAVGLLHGAVPADGADFDRSLPSQPPLAALSGIPLSMFETLSFAEIEGWHLLQSDIQLRTALDRLREWEQVAPKVPAHCDLRVDQLLVVGDEVMLTDWEEFRLADPARDVGSFAGEWLYRSVLDIVTTRGDTVFMDLELTHEMVLQRGVEKMERLLPRVRSFWRGYRRTRPDFDSELPIRATAFAGWHLLDRLMAGATRTSRLSGIERAAAGIGRAALLNPGKFVETIGLGAQA